VYALGDIVVTGEYHYHLCVVSHTSSTTFPPDDAFWETVFDATNVVLDAEAAATNAANSAAAAAASAAEAAASADEAEQAASLAVTAQSAFRWNFDASTVAADPGMGEVRFNNATLINITQLMLSAQSADFGNPNVSGWVITWDDSTNLTSRGSIYVRNAASPENFLVFDVNGPVVDNGTWQSVSVKYIAHGGALADGDNLAVAFTRTGNSGTSGSGSGDMLSTNNLSDVADPVAAADNIGVGPTDTPPFVQVVLSSPATISNHATRKEYVDSADAALQASLQANIDTKAPLASPAFTGNPTAPTPTAGNNDTSIATTAFVTTADAALQTSIKTYVDNQDALKADITYVNAQDALKAPIASPTFTGDPKAPTPSAGDNDTTIATTAFVANAVASGVVTSAVRYDAAQSLTDAQQVQAKTNIGAASVLAMRSTNMVLNGNMIICQFATNVDASNSNLPYGQDGWKCHLSNSSLVVNLTTVADGPPAANFSYSLKATIKTAASAPVASDYATILQPMENIHWNYLRWGWSPALPVGLGFWVKCSVTGTFTVGVCNGITDYSINSPFTVNAANTWEYKTVLFPPAPVGSNWVTNPIMYYRFGLMGGTNYNAPALNVWQNGNYLSSAGQTNITTMLNATFQISGVMMLPSWDVPLSEQSMQVGYPYDEELRRCQRYYELGQMTSSAYMNTAGTNVHGNTAPYKTVKRVTPTITLFGTTYGGQATNGSFALNSPQCNTYGHQWFISAAAAGLSTFWSGYYADARM
jgi:hypothetical protein